MWALQVFVVSLLLPSGTLAVSSLSPLDLFAYPAYTVRLNPSNPVSNSTAERILAAGQSRAQQRDGARASSSDSSSSRHDELQVQNDRKLDLLGLGLHDDLADDDARRQAQQPLLMGPSKPYLLRSGGNGQAYLCSVPQPELSASTKPKQSTSSSGRAKSSEAAIPATAEEKARQKAKMEEEKKHAFERGLALLEPLKGNCLYNTQGWFTYAFCYGSEIRQFHAIKNKNPQGPPLVEDLSQEAYTLGLWSNRLAEGEGLVDIKKGRALGSLREILESEDKSEEHALEAMNGILGSREDDIIGDEKRYLVQRWTGGTLCDKTGVDRHIEVQFHCNSQSSDRIFLVRETAICEYVIVIHTPRLCGEQIFVGGTSAADDAAEKRKKEVNIIECRPVVRDELYAHYLQEGAGRGGHAEQKTAPGLLDSSETGGSAKQKTAGETEYADQQQQTPLAVEEAREPAAHADAASEHVTSHQSRGEEQQPEQQNERQSEEFVIDSYVLAYDAETGQMRIERDPTALASEGGFSGQDSNGNANEDAAMQDLLTEFKKSLQEMMMGGMAGDVGRGDQEHEEGGALQEIIKQAREAVFKALQESQDRQPTAGSNEAREQESAGQGTGAEQEQHQQQNQAGSDRKAGEGKSRFTRTGTHNHRDVAERYLKGLGHPPAAGGPKIGKYRRPFEKGGAAPGQQQKQKQQQGKAVANGQQKLGSPQFRNMKRAFEQKWDGDAAPQEKKEESKGSVGDGEGALAASGGGHDEL